MLKTEKRIISIILLMALMLAACVVPAFAGVPGKKLKRYENYVFIGDSIAAGFGLESEDENPMEGGSMLTVDEHIAEGSYAQLVSKAIYAESVFKLAHAGWTADNVLSIVDPTYESTGMMQQDTDSDEVTALRETSIKAISEADMITVNLGNNDCTMMVMQNLRSQFQSDDEFDITEARGILGTMDQTILQYEANYDRLIGRIRELNPDCDIYVLGMYDLFGSMEPKNLTQHVLEELNLKLCDELKSYYTEESEHKDDITYVDILETETFAYHEYGEAEYYTDFMLQVHPSAEGHKYIAQQILAAIPQDVMHDLI